VELGVVDIRRWLDADRTGPADPECRGKVETFAAMITRATLRGADSQRPRCWRMRCGGPMRVLLVPGADRIAWECMVCGHRGVLTGWRGLLWDMSEHPSS
jgi:hypothetical protein